MTIDLDLYPYEVSEIAPEEGGGFQVHYPDVPGCLGVGATRQDAIADGRLALFACLDALKAVDRPLPAPSMRPA